MPLKLSVFALLLFHLSVTVHAQFKKGMQIVGASIGSVFFNSGTSEVSYPAPTIGFTSKSISYGINISPSIGWFISDHTAIGATLTMNPSNNKTSYEGGGNTFQKDKLKAFNIGLGGFGRNYFNSSSSFKPYGQLGLSLGISSQSTEGFFYATSYKDTYNGKSSGGFFASASLSLGMTKLLNPDTGLDFYAGYTFSHNKNTFKTTTLRDDGNNGSIDATTVNESTTKSTNNGFILGIGFQIFLRPGK
jgi:hypothetical protein